MNTLEKLNDDFANTPEDQILKDIEYAKRYDTEGQSVMIEDLVFSEDISKDNSE